ncbi:FHA domain-containing protein [Stackebrandtia nassauensis]|uniref:FHA domain-containing protein n=1 Tax=Stackebrandtia nassauensis (strain DSM 44728 / CIP 108903 / NRRL B-16338 / NBRC 102104 / LLR-40K-21) TaxID=446470 RepID=D3QBV1_STANL|nr:FHA domain-containing protein [Stackebrandtia nassauensis]ADD44840.1 hypothetical protein Snas_5205 [Stackebrandtia nassauensis DSM 44728]
MTEQEFRPRFLPSSMRSLASEVPPAPPGSIFVLAATGGFASPPRKFTIHFGRNAEDVHVPVGVDDTHVSRQHGKLICHGKEWWLRNDGKLPIRLPGEAMLLSGYSLPLEPGYTPVFIGTSKRKSHLLEIQVTGSGQHYATGAPNVATAPPITYDFDHVERLVLTALAQRYLRGERYPQPVSWNQVADDLNRAAPERQWTSKGVAHRVSVIRERLAGGENPIPGILREDGVGEPVGNTLNHNLIQVLLETANLLPMDLELLGEDLG